VARKVAWCRTDDLAEVAGIFRRLVVAQPATYAGHWAQKTCWRTCRTSR